MDVTAEQIADNFLEISSEQRLNIILHLNERPWNMSALAKKLNVTVPEIHRNFGRLQKVGFVIKNSNGDYQTTSVGRVICQQIPTFSFLIKNKKYFDSHDFSFLPEKFIQRFGSLDGAQMINGYVKVTEQWKDIYKNSQKYIYNILIEIPYNQDLLKIIEERLRSGITIRSIFSELAIVPKERKEMLARFDFSKFTKDGKIERKMIKDTKIAIILNESEAGLSFPGLEEADMSKMLYSKDNQFHEWCLDYFKENWENAGSFQESKLDAYH